MAAATYSSLSLQEERCSEADFFLLFIRLHTRKVRTSTHCFDLGYFLTAVFVSMHPFSGILQITVLSAREEPDS